MCAGWLLLRCVPARMRTGCYPRAVTRCLLASFVSAGVGFGLLVWLAVVYAANIACAAVGNDAVKARGLAGFGRGGGLCRRVCAFAAVGRFTVWHGSSS